MKKKSFVPSFQTAGKNTITDSNSVVVNTPEKVNKVELYALVNTIALGLKTTFSTV